jgi:N-acetylglucosamine kinase-like BadF-type ATPase
MKYYLGVDGGGTKINLILFNQRYELISEGTGGGVTTSYLEVSVVRQHMTDAIEALLKPFAGQRIKVERAMGVLIGPVDVFQQCLEAAMDVGAFEACDEGYMYLLAGLLTDKGGVALAGTGDGAVYINGRNEIYHCGGYGSYMGEDGSGWWIGNRGMFAAIQMMDGWGPDTLLKDLLFEYLEVQDTLEDRYQLINGVYSNPKGIPHHSVVAGFTRYVSRAAQAGDAVALDIVRQAGELMARKMIGCYRINHADPAQYPIVACGGAWKVHPAMLTVCNEYLDRHMPGARVRYGRFEPILAGVIDQMIADGVDPHEREDFLKKEYKHYIVKVG